MIQRISKTQTVFSKRWVLGDETAIYADVFDMLPDWITTLQPYFQHMIEPEHLDYQISFRDQGAWPPSPKQPKKDS